MNLFRILSFVLFQTIVLFSSGQSVSTIMGAHSLGLANASATLGDDWALLSNVGGLSKIKTTSIAIAYEAKPSLIGANRMAAIISLPTKIGTGAFGVFRFGDNLYSEQIISVGFGNEFGSTSLGVKINYVQYRILGFGNKTAVSITFGGITQLTSMLSIGAYIVNLNQPKLSTIDGEKLPTHLIAGISFKPTETVALFTEVDKDLNYNPIIKGAIEYKVHKKVFVRTGFNLQPQAAFFGMGFISSQLKIDYAIQYNQNLATAFQISVVYQFIKLHKKQ